MPFLDAKVLIKKSWWFCKKIVLSYITQFSQLDKQKIFLGQELCRKESNNITGKSSGAFWTQPLGGPLVGFSSWTTEKVRYGCFKARQRRMTLTSILGKLKICLRLLPFAEHSRLMREEFWFKLNDHGSYARRLPYITDLSETISLFKSFKIDLKFLTVEAWRRVLNFNKFWNALNVRWQVGRIIHNIKMQPMWTVAKQLKTIWENITQEHLG